MKLNYIAALLCIMLVSPVNTALAHSCCGGEKSCSEKESECCKEKCKCADESKCACENECDCKECAAKE